MGNAAQTLVMPAGIDLGTLIDSCEVTTNFSGSGATVSQHTGNNRLSTRSASVRIQNSGTGTLFPIKSGLTPAQLVDAEWETYGALVYNARDFDSVTLANLPDMRVDMRTTGGAKSCVANAATSLRQGWNWAHNCRWDTPSSNGYTIAGDNAAEILFRCTGHASLAYDCYVTGIYRNPRPPVLPILWHFDDVWQTGYDAFKSLCYDKYGWLGTMFVAKSLTNPAQPHTMTLSGLQAAAALGFQMGNHSTAHGNMDTYNAAAFRADMVENEAYLLSNGLYPPDTAADPYEGIRQYAFPFGRALQTQIDVLRTDSYTLGRAGYAPAFGSAIADAVNPFGVGVAINLDATMTEANLRAYFARARAHRAPIRILVHGANSEGGASCTPQIFRSAVEEAVRCTKVGYEVMREVDYRRRLGAIPAWW